MAGSSNRWSVDLGLFVLRLGVGGMFLAHGLPKLMGGPAFWEKLGGAMAFFGVTFWPAAWGLMAALAESLGGIALMAGVFVRPFAALMLFVMVVAVRMHVALGQDFNAWSHAAELGIVFLSLVLMGAGRFRCTLVRRGPKSGTAT